MSLTPQTLARTSAPSTTSAARRELLRFAGLTAAGCLASGIAPGLPAGALANAREATADGAFRGKIRKAVKFHMIQEPLNESDKLKLLKDLGFQGLEVRTQGRDAFDPVALRKASEATGVEVHGTINSSHPDIRSAIELAASLGGTSVLVVAGRVDRDNRYDDVYRKSQEIIRAAVPHAEKHKIKILVENVWNNHLLSPLEMARFVDELKSPWVGVYFDVGNVVRFGWPHHWIEILGKRIGKLDIKEYSRAKQKDEGLWKGFDVAIGEGDCDWPAVRRALASIGYSGWATAEVRGGPRKRLEEISQRMDAALDL